VSTENCAIISSVPGEHGRLGERGVLEQLVVNLDFLGDADAVRHLDDENPVEERFVVLVVAEAVPLGLVRVRDDQAVERDSGKAFGSLEVAFLRRGEQRVQHLDRRLEHLDELEETLVRETQTARIAVRIGVVLRKLLELADVDLADERRNVLVVFVTGFGLRDCNLAQHGRIYPYHLKL
jgi:hypothetical protein